MPDTPQKTVVKSMSGVGETIKASQLADIQRKQEAKLIRVSEHGETLGKQY